MIINYFLIVNFNLIFFLVCLEGYKVFFYLEVDVFFLEYVRKLELNGGIRYWIYFS